MSDRQPVQPQDDLIVDVLCDQADQTTAQQWANMIRSNTQLENELAQHQRVMQLLSPDAPPMPDADFQRQLWEKINPNEAQATHELQSSSRQMPMHTPGRFHRLMRSWPTAGLAAAIVLLCWVLPTIMQSTDRNVAWADVVAAFNQIKACHIIAFMEDPSSSKEERKLAKWEMYYRSPNLWRAQAFNHVDFRNEKVNKIYDAKARAFVDRKTAKLRLIPDELYKGVEQGDFLACLLEMMFDTKDVKRTAVKNTQLAGTTGIEVFDYALDATHQWARVWVLSESRLPIHMKVYQPRFDEFYDVSFDYSDPQPAEFFDPDLFEQIVKEQDLREPHEIMKAGIKSIAGKPVNSINVAQQQGPETMPEITRVLGVENGSFLLETMPIDRVDRHVHIERKWLDPTDNWGNTYVQVSETHGITGRPDNRFHYVFVPIPPFQFGEDKRIVTFQYAVYPGASALRELDMKLGIINFPAIQRHVGFSEAELIPKRLRDEFKEGRQNWALQRYQSSTQWRPFAHERFEVLEKQLATDVSNGQRIETLHEQYKLLNLYKRKDRAEQLMSDKLIPLILKSDPLAKDLNVDILTRHMMHLYEKQQYERFDQFATILTEQIQSFSSRQQKDQRVQHMIERPYLEMSWVLDVIEGEKKFSNMTLPRIVDIQRVKEGYVVVQIQLPQKSYTLPNGKAFEAEKMWDFDASTGENLPRRTHVNGVDGQTKWIVLHTDQTMVTVTGRFRVADNRFNDARKHYALGTYPIPTQETIPSIIDWWLANTGNVPFPFNKSNLNLSKYEKHILEAGQLYHQKQYAQALSIYQQIMQLPKDDWPAYMFQSWHADGRTQYEHERAFIKTLIRNCQLCSGKQEEALAAIQKELDALPPIAPDAKGWIDQKLVYQRKALLDARLVWVRLLIDEQKLNEAKAMLDQMAEELPDLSRLLNEHVYIRNAMPNGGEFTTNFNPRMDTRRAWDDYQATLWDWYDARQSQGEDEK